MTLSSQEISTLINGSYLVTFLASLKYLEVTPVSVEVLAALLVADLITGIVRAGLVDGWRSIQSNKMQRGIMAKMFILLVPIILSLSGKAIGIDIGVIAQACINVLVLSEGYSIVGNIYSIRTGNERVEFDAISYVLKQVQGFLKNLIVQE